MDSTSSAISEMSTMLRRPPPLLIAAGIAGMVGSAFGSGGGPAGGRLLGRLDAGGIDPAEREGEGEGGGGGGGEGEGGVAALFRPAATSASSRKMRASSASICSRIAAASAMSRTICGLCSPVRRLRGSAMRGGSHNPITPSRTVSAAAAAAEARRRTHPPRAARRAAPSPAPAASTCCRPRRGTC